MKYRLLIIAILLVSCSSSKRISNQDLAYLYSPGVNFITPEYRIVNITPDSSRIFFNVLPAQLLFMKNDSLGIFKSSFAFNYQIFYNYESKVPIDTGSVYFDTDMKDDSLLYLQDFFDVKAPDSADYIIQITLTDINRQQAVASYLTIDRTGLEPSDDFYVMDANSNNVYVPNYVNTTATFRIQNPNTSKHLLYVRYFRNKFPLSSPPFSAHEVRPLSYVGDEVKVIDLLKNETITLDKPGIYHLQFDTLIKEGLTLFRFEEDFPRLTSAESLIESIRFLTTRQEYDKIVNSGDKKDAVDSYWLSMAGNRERARVLIRSYYSRVQTANVLFSSYLEGWKTDRGLIYIIFGPPATVYRSDNNEVWNYNQSYSYGSLNFTFEKINNPFTRNDYQLLRNTYYEMPWYRAIDSWRDGRVVNDNY